MTEVTFTHRDLEEGTEQQATAVFDQGWDDATICNSIRNGLMAVTGLELDELDMDDDGVGTREGNTIHVLWTASRGQQSVTTLTF